jgi:hypothetical protein
MGGPEIGQDVHVLIIATRKKIKQQFAGVAMPGISAMDVQIFLNGSVTQYFPSAGVKKIAFNKRKEEVVIDICVSQEESADITGLVETFKRRMLEAVDGIEDVAKKYGANFDAVCFSRCVQEIA